MAKQTINLGTLPTGVGGDTPRSAFTKAQANFDELYTQLGGTTLPAALPVTKGGTGGTTAATARTSLGLVPQTSATDTTAGALLTPGAFGWGLNGGTLTTISDANGQRPSGLYYILSGSGNVPVVGDGLLEVRNLSNAVLYQALTYWGTGRKFERIYVTNSWSPWFEILTTRNFVVSIVPGEIGSLSILKNLTGTTITSNSNVAGSQLSYSDTANASWGAPPGSWKCMSAVGANNATLFMRVA
jgi:hypothetical protein